jgi:hypothetical protein
MIKDRFSTSITIDGEWGKRAEEVKKRGIGYAEIFRQGVQYCEDYLQNKDKKEAK